MILVPLHKPSVYSPVKNFGARPSCRRKARTVRSIGPRGYNFNNTGLDRYRI